MKKNSKIKVVTGNEAAAIAASLCRPDVIAAYPITPQTEVIEKLSEYHANGLLDAELINVEGENSAMNSITAASLAGGRVFTATSSWGLVFMYDAILAASGARAPVVMANVNRETPGIIAVSCGQQDMISIRDSGWINLIAEDCQEILDMLIMAYRLAEDDEIQLPVMVNYDGFYLSYLSEKVEIPAVEEVDNFLSVLKKQPQRPRLLPGKSLGCGSHGILGGYLELRYKHCNALQRAKNKFQQITKEFQKQFSRNSGGQIEEYKTADADIVIVASGSMCGTIKTVIDEKREEGIKIGLVRIRMFRPFPEEELIRALSGKKSIGVIDRSVAFGFSGGPIYIEVKTLAQDINTSALISFIAGLANIDITVLNIEKIIADLIDASSGKPYKTVNWIPFEQEA
ncbi:MAG: pyruvate synthase subunit PorA [Deltaproteobacteria bacterium]|nr:pyruvate synthase subunit PorA [Deltaproteobacteria bacterium]